MTKCVFCRSNNFRDLFVINGSNIEICSGCGLIRTKGIFNQNYKNYHRDEDYEKSELLFKNISGKIYKDIGKFIKKKGEILEIGCSTGILLENFKKTGWKCLGVEPSASALVARKKGLKIIKSTFERAKLPSNYFDLVIINHTLEHFENPVKVLTETYLALKRGGKVYIGVPNVGSLSANIMGKRWPYILPLEHKYHFYPLILRRILEKIGFKILSEKSRSGIFNLENPALGLYNQFIGFQKNFVSDLLSAPGAFIATAIGKGTNLSIIAEK
jgi:SAM-dependent methyltransferase